jgi:hypothetical protein
MYQPLVPCPSCKRHVRAAEAACPFCSSALPEDLAAGAIPSAPRRLSRAAAFVFGASLAVAGCGTDTDGGSAGGGENNSSSSSGSSSSTSGGVDAGPEDDGGQMALYGLPADAGPDDDGGGQAEYGAPAPMDAGPKDDGGAMPLYGAPPKQAG